MKHGISLLALLLLVYLAPCVMTSWETALEAQEGVFGSSRRQLLSVGELFRSVNVPVLMLAWMASFRKTFSPTILVASAGGLGLLLDGLSNASRLGHETITCLFLMFLLLAVLPTGKSRPWIWLPVIALATLLHQLSMILVWRQWDAVAHLLAGEVVMTTLILAVVMTLLRTPRIWLDRPASSSLVLENRWDRLTPG